MLRLMPDGVRTGDGVELALSIRTPERPSAVVVLSHSMMANARSLDRPAGKGLATALVDAGFLVILADLRGHGRSRPTVSEGLSFSYDDLVRYDAPALLDHARQIAAGLPVFCVGHSLYGHVSLAACGTGRAIPDGIVTFASSVWSYDDEPTWTGRLRKAATLELTALLSRPLGRLPARRLGIGSDDEPYEYFKQFRAWTRGGRWRSVGGDVDYVAALASVDVPVLAIAGGADRQCPPEAIARFVASIPNHRLFTVPGADHVQLACAAEGRLGWVAAAEFMREVAANSR